MSVTEPSSEMFWTIMSTTIDSVGKGAKHGGGDTRAILHVPQGDLGFSLGQRDA